MATAWEDLFDVLHEVPQGASPYIAGCLLTALADATSPVYAASHLRKYIQTWRRYDGDLDTGREGGSYRLARASVRGDTGRVLVGE